MVERERTPPARSKQEQIYEVIRGRVIEGTYNPGYRLVIDAIAAEMKVSALPVREAIRRLEAEGLVVYRANIGAQVAPVDPDLYESELVVMAVLEGFATAEMAVVADPEDFDLLDARTDEMRACMERFDMLGFGRANQEFHTAIYQRCGNPYLITVLTETSERLDTLRRTVFTHIPYRGLASIEEHRHLVGLMRDGAPFAEIEGAAREHKLATRTAFRAWQDEHAPGPPA